MGRGKKLLSLCVTFVFFSLNPSRCKDFGEAVDEGFQSFRSVAAGLFGDAPAVVADVIEGFHHRGPVVIAFEEADLEAFPKSFVIALFAAEFFDVKFLNAFTENANPLFRPAVGDDVADVEMPADSGTLEFIDIT